MSRSLKVDIMYGFPLMNSNLFGEEIHMFGDYFEDLSKVYTYLASIRPDDYPIEDEEEALLDEVEDYEVLKDLATALGMDYVSCGVYEWHDGMVNFLGVVVRQTFTTLYPTAAFDPGYFSDNEVAAVNEAHENFSSGSIPPRLYALPTFG